MNERSFLNLYPFICIDGRMFRGVVRSERPATANFVRLDYFGIELDRTQGLWCLTEKMIEQELYYNASFVNSLGGERASFAVVCPCVTTPPADPTELEEAINTGAWVFRDNVGYDTYVYEEDDVNAHLSHRLTEVPGLVHVEFSAVTYKNKTREDVGGFLHAVPKGSLSSETLDTPTPCHTLVAVPAVLRNELEESCVYLVDSSVNELFADMPEATSAPADSNVVADGKYCFLPNSHIAVTDMAALMLCANNPLSQAHRIYSLGAPKLTYHEYVVLTDEELGEVETDSVDVPIPEVPTQDDGIYQIKNPLTHSIGIGRVRDLLIPISKRMES